MAASKSVEMRPDCQILKIAVQLTFEPEQFVSTGTLDNYSSAPQVEAVNKSCILIPVLPRGPSAALRVCP